MSRVGDLTSELNQFEKRHDEVLKELLEVLKEAKTDATSDSPLHLLTKTLIFKTKDLKEYIHVTVQSVMSEEIENLSEGCRLATITVFEALDNLKDILGELVSSKSDYQELLEKTTQEIDQHFPHLSEELKPMVKMIKTTYTMLQTFMAGQFELLIDQVNAVIEQCYVSPP